MSLIDGHAPETQTFKSPHRGRVQPFSRLTAWLATAALVLILLGFCGLDRWVYMHVSLATNTPSFTDEDFYHRTHWIWDAVRLFSGRAGVIAAVFLIALIHRRGWRVALLATVVVLSVDFAGLFMQGAVGRLRPNHSDLSDPYSHLRFVHPRIALSHDAPVCFPSGEATAAFALAAALAQLWPRRRMAWYGVAVLCALERILHGAHYISDVTAGALLGALLTDWLFARMLPYAMEPTRADPETPSSAPVHA